MTPAFRPFESASPAKGARLLKAPGQSPALAAMERPTPGPGELLVRVAAVGMCRTDLLVANGSLPVERPLTLGHEFSGWVEARGEETESEFGVGALVCANPTFDLPSGRDGFMGVDADGALATWVVIDQRKCHAAAGLDPRQAAYLEPIAAAMGGLDAARAAGGRGVILGANRIADLTSAIFSRPNGSEPVAHDRVSMEHLAQLPDCHCDWLLESRMSRELMIQAARVLKPGGRLILKSRHMEEVDFPVRDFVLKRLSLVGRTRAGFPEAMEWLRANADFVATLIGDSYPLARWQDAFSAAESGEGKKVFVIVAEA